MSKILLLLLFAAIPFQAFSMSRTAVYGTYFRGSDQNAGDPNYKQKMGTMLLMIQEFYKKEMQRNGYGSNKTFFLATDRTGNPAVIFYKAKNPYSFYANPDGSGWGLINQEMSIAFGQLWPIMKAATIYDGAGAWGGGSLGLSILDMSLLGKTRQEQLAIFCDQTIVPSEYGNLKKGHLASIRIGGMAHELGHTFGLPHDPEGYSMMSAGFHGFANNFATPGCAVPATWKTIIVPAHAAVLANSPWFN